VPCNIAECLGMQPSALECNRVPWNATECHQVYNCHLHYCIYEHCFCTGYKYYVHVQHSNDVVLASFQVTTTVCNAVVLASFRVTPTGFGIIFLIIIFHTFVADLSTHGNSPCLFYSSQICVTPIVLILVNTHRVFFKYSEQFTEC
jgi:hypothetical protein